MKPEETQECCPPFDPIPWNEKFIEWENKKFIKEQVFTFLYMPINFGGAMKRADAKIAASGNNFSGTICLSDHTSAWNMDIYIAVDNEVAGAENFTFSGKFFSKVYEGPFSNTGKWTKDFGEIAKSKNIPVNKMYMWYTTCPKCAKKYGKNYTVILTKVE